MKAEDPFGPPPIIITNPYKNLPPIVSAAKPTKRNSNFTKPKKRRK